MKSLPIRLSGSWIVKYNTYFCFAVFSKQYSTLCIESENLKHNYNYGTDKVFRSKGHASARTIFNYGAYD